MMATNAYPRWSFADYLRSLEAEANAKLEDVASLRPTLYVGLGGFGCTVLRMLKRHIGQTIPDRAGGFAFLGLDTHPRSPSDELTLREYIPLSVGVDPNIVAKTYPELSWFPKVCGPFKPKQIQGGADKVKAVGRLAFRHPPTFDRYSAALATIHNELKQPRQGFAPNSTLKVYVISTMAGGTGAGCLLDVMATLGKRFRQLEGADFPYQAVLASPDVLVGEANPGDLDDFYANTYATLKEIHHFLTGEAEVMVDYDHASFHGLQVSQQNLPQTIHLIGDKNEGGDVIVTKIEDLAGLVVSYLLSEIETPMHDQAGQPKVQDMENQYYGDLGLDQMPRAFSSFGTVRTGVPIDIVSSLFSLQLIRSALSAELQTPADCMDQANTWIGAERLAESGTDQVQDQIKGTILNSLRAIVAARSELLGPGTKYDDLGERCKKYISTQKEALHEAKKPLIDQEAEKIRENAQVSLDAQFEMLRSETGLGHALAFGESLAAVLQGHETSLIGETTAAKARIESVLDKDVDASAEGAQAAVPGWLGRRDRVAQAVDDFEARLEVLLNAQVDVWVKEAGQTIYSALKARLDERRATWGASKKALTGYLASAVSLITQTQSRLDHLADVAKRGSGNRFSLVDGEKSKQLYKEIIQPQESGCVQRIRRSWVDAGWMRTPGLSAEKWLDSVVPDVMGQDVLPVIQAVRFSKVMKRFYDSAEEQRTLFQTLQNLSAPLFWLDPNRKESHYHCYWIIGVHPEERDQFSALYQRHLAGNGVIYSFCDSPYEVVLYQLKMGYTLHSYRGVEGCERNYDRLENLYLKGRSAKKAVRPLHGWLEALEWENPIPRGQEEENALAAFILGRAFSTLYPPAGGGKGSYLYAKGSNYYLQLAQSAKPIDLGKGLAAAFTEFSNRPDLQVSLGELITAKTDQVGQQEIQKALKDNYLPTLKSELEKAEGSDPERETLLRKFLVSLEEHIADLQPRAI